MDVFKALGNQNRRKILQILMQKETHIAELAKELTISNPVALKHARVLEEVGLIERKKVGNAHVLSIKKEALEKIKKVWELFKKPLSVKVKKGSSLLDALKKVDGLKIEEEKEGALITSVDGNKGFFIYTVNEKFSDLSIDKFKIEKNCEIELKRLLPVVGKNIQIKVEK